MKLKKAWLCVEPDCEEIFEKPSAEGKCPSCGSKIFMALSAFLDREPVESGVTARLRREAGVADPHGEDTIEVPFRRLEDMEARVLVTPNGRGGQAPCLVSGGMA